ncbi:MAG: AAA family ATPase [Desulfobacterales bacterium]|jgi:general secretion pathway protein A|nr:AAA family ATPase [Desulfobacterales bacterium]
MFYDFYGLTGLPFEEWLIPEKLLPDPRFAKGSERLEYFAEAGLAALLTGPTGVGKTSLWRLFLSRLPANRYQPVIVTLSALESACLLRLMVVALNEKPRTGKDRLFSLILNKLRASDRATLLIVDEAHLLGEMALTDLRLLLCAGLEERLQIRLLLSGQDGLLSTLSRQTLADLRNRVTVRVHLGPLSRDQTVCYLDHRIKAFGGTEKLFAEEAKMRMHDHTGGIPRLLNNLATLCLIQGASKKQKQINVALVDEAARESQLI